MNAGLAAPPFPVGGEGAKERLGVLDISRDVVVPQDDDFAVEGSELFDDSLHQPLPQLALVHHRHSAEITAERTAAGGKQNSGGVVAPMKEVLPRCRGFVQGRRLKTVVAPGVTSSLKLCQESRPLQFGFSDEDHIRVHLRLVRHQGYVRPTHGHRDSALAEASGKIVGVRRAGGMKGDCY